jgi:hypothetical protein
MRGATDSMIIGFIALRVLNGGVIRKVAESIAIGLFTLSVLNGCSTQSAKSVENEKTVQYAAERNPVQHEPIVTEKHTTKTEETKREGQSAGLLSGTVNVVGQAIALPFRLVAGLVELAF